MCGLFGYIAKTHTDHHVELQRLAALAEQRGRDAAGMIAYQHGTFHVTRGQVTATDMMRKFTGKARMVAAHSRLATNGQDIQPVVRDRMMVVHNGIITNTKALWQSLYTDPLFDVDTEVIIPLIKEGIDSGLSLMDAGYYAMTVCEGVMNAVVVMPDHASVMLISNNGSLYTGYRHGTMFFASENHHLREIGCLKVKKLIGVRVIKMQPSRVRIKTHTITTPVRRNLLPEYVTNTTQEAMLQYERPEIRRCTCCILPETMPFIEFDDDGVCNYCRNYKTKNEPKPMRELLEVLKPYRKRVGADCIVPFSGGRDSSFALHMIVEKLGMRPVTYTYDWGMVTDLGRRNISRMCAALSVENIIIADDIHMKRRNIRMNLEAWLRRPHLGMLVLLMAGDKHFYRHVETVKQRTGIDLNIWGVNPMEMTHFKAGFMGVPPAWDLKYIYSQSWMRQLIYQRNRAWQMMRNPAYLNSSLADTITGEYWRSWHKKSDYFHFYDYYKWDEQEIEETLDAYQWERATDTRTTWRIGDGTAAFYNYVWYTVAGFSEHDTFRSNQVREGQLTRDAAMRLAERDNAPRYQTIRWYLDAVGVDFERAINIINNIPKRYEIHR